MLNIKGKLSVLEMTRDIVIAYAGNNTLPAGELPELITKTFETLVKKIEMGLPRAPVRESVFPDYIICLEDGERFKCLKRHLKTKYNLSPEAYRAKWGLSPDYPMVAPNYSKKRSDLAKKMSLGQKVYYKQNGLHP